MNGTATHNQVLVGHMTVLQHINTTIHRHESSTSRSRRRLTLSRATSHKQQQDKLLDVNSSNSYRPNPAATGLSQSLTNLITTTTSCSDDINNGTDPPTGLSSSTPLVTTKTSHHSAAVAQSDPKENISSRWREIQGCNDWENLLDPLHPWLRNEIIKYGEFAQATYDAFDLNPYSEYYGSCRYSRSNIFEKLGLKENGYHVTKYFYALSSSSFIDINDLPKTWQQPPQNKNYKYSSGEDDRSGSKRSNWMGFVAVSDDEESRRIGRRDIVVAWRGTVAASEWYEDLKQELEPIDNDVHGRVADTRSSCCRVQQGFVNIYRSKCDSTMYNNKYSASEQVIQEISRLLNVYSEQEAVSLTLTGHSLGGALSLLNAYEAATLFPDLPITVISFGAPRAGNKLFRDALQEMGVKTLRLAIKQDLIPRMPGIIFNESLESYLMDYNDSTDLTATVGKLMDNWVYAHVGVEFKLDALASPYLKRGLQLQGHHMLETYLHLVDGFSSSSVMFRDDAKRDVALVNKECDLLIDELKIPPCWYQEAGPSQ